MQFSSPASLINHIGHCTFLNVNCNSGEYLSRRYGEEAAKAVSEGLDAAGHAVGAAWATLKIRQALNPRGALKHVFAKSAVEAASAELKEMEKEKGKKKKAEMDKNKKYIEGKK